MKKLKLEDIIAFFTKHDKAVKAAKAAENKAVKAAENKSA